MKTFEHGKYGDYSNSTDSVAYVLLYAKLLIYWMKGKQSGQLGFGRGLWQNRVSCELYKAKHNNVQKDLGSPSCLE